MAWLFQSVFLLLLWFLLLAESSVDFPSNHEDGRADAADDGRHGAHGHRHRLLQNHVHVAGTRSAAGHVSHHRAEGHFPWGGS